MSNDTRPEHEDFEITFAAEVPPALPAAVQSPQGGGPLRRT
ncbi:hypothetical protein [Glycomyces sp. MUSA5-2]